MVVRTGYRAINLHRSSYDRTCISIHPNLVLMFLGDHFGADDDVCSPSNAEIACVSKSLSHHRQTSQVSLILKDLLKLGHHESNYLSSLQQQQRGVRCHLPNKKVCLHLSSLCVPNMVRAVQSALQCHPCAKRETPLRGILL